MHLCYQVISTKLENEVIDIKHRDYFNRMTKIYNPDFKFEKEQSLFNAKLKKGIRKDKTGNQYIERIIKDLSDYNKLVFVYTISDLLYINTTRLDNVTITGDTDILEFVSKLLVEEGLFKDLEHCYLIMLFKKKIKLYQIEMIESFGCDLDDRGKDAIIYFLMHFGLISKNRNQAIEEFLFIATLINYDTNRIEFNEDTSSLSDKFISKDDALNCLLNKDIDSKETFVMLVKMIITSNNHYSIQEQVFFIDLVINAELPEVLDYEKNQTHLDWLLLNCDTDIDRTIEDSIEKMKNDYVEIFELNEKINNEKNLKGQEILFKTAIKKYPKGWSLQNSYCNNLYNQKKFIEGIKISQKLIDKNPKNPMYYDTCAMGYYHVEDYNKALELMNKGFELDPKGEYCYLNEHYYNRGNVLIKMNKIKDAKKDFKAALNFNLPYFKKNGTPLLKKVMEKMVADVLEQL